MILRINCYLGGFSVNRCQFIFKTSVLALVLMSNAISFGMIVRYKDEQSTKAVQASVASCLKPIYEKEKEMVKALPLEEQGLYNLEKLYKNRHNPKFVQKFLSNEGNYVPVVLVHNAVNVNPEKGIELGFFGVNPYHESFYHPYHPPFFNPYGTSFFSDSHEKISTIGKERFRKAFKQKRINCIYKNPSVYEITYDDNKNYPLVMASLFGNDEDIQKELKSNPSRQATHHAALAFINYPNKNNNALELLLPKIKQEGKQLFGDSIQFDKEARVILSYALLGASADNKEIFEFIAQKDPYNANRIKAYDPLCYFDHKKRTTLDLMISHEKYFGEENIQTFIDNGGCTAKTLKKMKYIGNIIEHLPNRRYSMTPEERMASDHFDRLTYATFRRIEMERNQRLNIPELTEPDVD